MFKPTILAASFVVAVLGDARADTFTVTSTASVGAGTLYQAVTDAAGSPGPHTIDFDLPAGSHIAMSHILPPIVSNALTIDGANVPGLVIDGGGVVRLLHIAAPNVTFRLANIELRRGRGGRVGGCLLAQNPSDPAAASVTLDRVVMRECEARRTSSGEMVAGGAVHVDRRSVTVVNSRFIGNRAYTDDPALATNAVGGAISVMPISMHLVHIEDSHFIGNQVTGSAENGVGCCRASGAAVDALGTGVLALRRNRFIDNHADTLDQSTTWGSVVKSTMSTTLSGNLLFGNESLGSMILLHMSHPTSTFARVENNTLVANSSRNGAALDLTGVADSTVRNNTFLAWFGQSFPLAHLRVLPFTGEPSSLVLSHNLFGPPDSRWPDPTRPICFVHADVAVDHHRNQVLGGADGCGPTVDPDATDLRIDALRLQGGAVETVSFFAGSPVLDAGNPLPPLSADPSRCQTVDGRDFSRPGDGSGNGAAVCDIGAWESQHEAALFRHDFEQALWRP